MYVVSLKIYIYIIISALGFTKLYLLLENVCFKEDLFHQDENRRKKLFKMIPFVFFLFFDYFFFLKKVFFSNKRL